MRKNSLLETLILAGVVVLFTSFSFAQEEACVFKCSKDEKPKLIIARTGKVEAEPDKAIVNIRITTEETKIDKAADRNNDKMNLAMEILKENAIEKKDIKTTEYNILPLYEGKSIFSPVQRPTSYRVTHSISVNFYKLDTIGKILSKISEIEYVNVYNLTFTSTKIEELKREALKKAAQSAREAALDLVEAAGGKLGKVLRIEEAPEPFIAARQRVFAEKTKAAYDVSEAEVTPGTLEIEARCTITYEIAP